MIEATVEHGTVETTSGQEWKTYAPSGEHTLRVNLWNATPAEQEAFDRIVVFTLQALQLPKEPA